MTIDEVLDLKKYNEEQTEHINKLYAAHVENYGHIRRFDYVVDYYIKDGHAEEFRATYIKKLKTLS